LHDRESGVTACGAPKPGFSIFDGDDGFVTLPCRGREVSAAQKISRRGFVTSIKACEMLRCYRKCFEEVYDDDKLVRRETFRRCVNKHLVFPEGAKSGEEPRNGHAREERAHDLGLILASPAATLATAAGATWMPTDRPVYRLSLLYRFTAIGRTRQRRAFRCQRHHCEVSLPQLFGV
jgi:hypothetical protein